MKLTQRTFSSTIEEQHLGHWNVIGHHCYIQRSQTLGVHTEISLNAVISFSKTLKTGQYLIIRGGAHNAINLCCK